MSLRVEREGRELLRVEVLEARASGFAKFRLWYYKWHETRPDQPYVDVEIKSYHFKGGKIGFKGRLYANETKGIYKEHLVEITELLKRGGVEGVWLRSDGKGLEFSGAFRDSVLRKLGVRPELPPGEPPAVEYLGGLRFRVGGQEVEFRERAEGARREFYAELKFPSEKEAENFAKSLMAVGVDAKIGSEKDGYKVRLDSDAFFGLLAATNATPPGLKPLYRSNDLQVYASVEEGRMRFYFAVKHGGMWRAVEGLYVENRVQLWRAERDVLETIRGAVIKALKMLGRKADVEEPKEDRDEKGNVKGHYLLFYGPYLKPFLEYAADGVEAKPVKVRLEGRRIAINVGDVKAETEFKLLKGKEAVSLPVQDVGQTLALYKSLREVGVPVELTPDGIRIDGKAMWALVATAVKRSAPSKLPAEVMPGVELMKVYSTGGMEMYIFRAAGDHYYFVVKTGESWRVTGGKHTKWHVQIAGESARTVAEAINAIYREMGVERKVEVRDNKKGVPYINLTNEDLRQLGLTPRQPDG